MIEGEWYELPEATYPTGGIVFVPEGDEEYRGLQDRIDEWLYYWKPGRRRNGPRPDAEIR